MRILLVDDHAKVRQAIRKMLEMQPEWRVVAESCDGHEASLLAANHQPDLAIVDAAMPGLNGVEATRRIAANAPHTRILVLSMYDDEQYVSESMSAGAAGYVLKQNCDTELLAAVQEVARGGSFVSPALCYEPPPRFTPVLD
jgi:DNA-binding NarL/FixJ family response regulator